MDMIRYTQAQEYPSIDCSRNQYLLIKGVIFFRPQEVVRHSFNQTLQHPSTNLKVSTAEFPCSQPIAEPIPGIPISAGGVWLEIPP